jgi:hypothetical protein
VPVDWGHFPTKSDFMNNSTKRSPSAKPLAARIIRTVGVSGLLVVSAGCTILPGSGPSLMEVASEAASPTPEGGYVLFDISERIVSISSASHANPSNVFLAMSDRRRICASAYSIRWS